MIVDMCAPLSEAQAALEWFQIMADAAPVMIWMSGTDKRSFYFNRPWLDFTGRTLQDEIGTGWSEVLHPDDVHRCLSTYSRAFDARETFEMECRQRRHDGEWRVVLGRGKPMTALDGTFLGYIGSCLDVTDRKRAEDVREQLLVDGIKDYAIYWLSAEGCVASWNAGAERLTGYRAGEVIGHHFSEFFPPDDIQQGKPVRLLRIAETEGRAEADGWHVRKDRTPFWANVVLTALRDDAGQLRGFAKVTHNMTEVHHLRQQRDVIERERLLDEERKRIARDLHDGVLQVFFGIGLVASVAQADAATGGAMANVSALNKLNGLAIDGANQLREAIFALNHAEVTFRRLVPSLRRLAREFRERTSIEADLVVTGATRRLPTNAAETLYATAREALSNVEQHAQAHAVVLGVHFDRPDVTLCIQDDGRGVSSVGNLAAVGNGARHYGLRSVSDRVHDLNGTLEAGPNPDGGFVVRARLPLALADSG